MNLRKNVKPLVFILLLLCSVSLQAQYQNSVYTNYFDKYKGLAIDHMNRYRIPASITLAQGVLESGAGQSKLAKEANNHFGIKCHTEWKGPKTYHDDDRPNDCFRKYKNAEESFLDHSVFLAERSRYARLFELDIRDYKGWARGLQSCGYATDPNYANKLIKIIEDYELYLYDIKQGKAKKTDTQTPSKKSKKEEVILFDKPLQVFKHNGLIYVHARQGDTFKTIADEMGFKESKLAKYNEVPKDFPLDAGDIVYLQKKKTKADKPNYEHVIKGGESMYSISQKYGMQLSPLYKLNRKEPDYFPKEGDILRLR